MPIALGFLMFFFMLCPAVAAEESGLDFTFRANMRYRLFVFEDLSSAGPSAKDESQIEVYTDFLIDREFSNHISFHLNPRLVLSARRFPENATAHSDNAVNAEIRGLSLRKAQLFHPLASLTLGRSRLKEERAWWWDEDFTSFRLAYDATLLYAEVGFGERLLIFDITEEDREDDLEDIRLIFGEISAQWFFQHYLEARFLYQKDNSGSGRIGDNISLTNPDEEDGELFWLGFRAKGETSEWRSIHRARYWLDFSVLYGDLERLTTQNSGGRRIVTGENSMEIKGAWAADMGMTFETSLPLQPAFTLSYALASGDRAENGSVRQFKQPDLSTNRGRLLGNTLIRYYGEALAPDLSNLHILTYGFAVPVIAPLRFQTVAHIYRQDVAVPRLQNARLGRTPAGNSRDIGEEIDFVLEGAPAKWWNITFVFGIFRAGQAYEEAAGELAYWNSFQLRAVF